MAERFRKEEETQNLYDNLELKVVNFIPSVVDRNFRGGSSFK